MNSQKPLAQVHLDDAKKLLKSARESDPSQDFVIVKRSDVEGRVFVKRTELLEMYNLLKGIGK